MSAERVLLSVGVMSAALTLMTITVIGTAIILGFVA
jgi:hypothetical protein